MSNSELAALTSSNTLDFLGFNAGALFSMLLFQARHKDNSLDAVKIASEKYHRPTDRIRKLEEVRKHEILSAIPKQGLLKKMDYKEMGVMHGAGQKNVHDSMRSPSWLKSRIGHGHGK